MTYLELVNDVLARMREDAVTTVQGADDEVVKLVAKLVNDAKRKCEDAWKWNALRYEWTLTMVDGTDTYTLVPSDTNVTLDYVWNDTRRYEVKKSTPRYIKTKGVTSGLPHNFAINGSDANRQVKLQVWPVPNVADTVSVNGWKPQLDLALDDDILLIPHLPVIQEALANALRERGEVGGQTAIEVFGVAKLSLSDAIALDAGMGEDTNWYAV